MSGFEPPTSGSYVTRDAAKIAIGQTDESYYPGPQMVTFMVLPAGDNTWVCAEMDPAAARMTAARLLNRADEVEAINAKRP